VPVTAAFFQNAQIGMAVLALDDPADPGSLRVMEVNEAARRTAVIPDDIIGKKAAEIPEAAHLPQLADVARVIREHRPIDLGDMPGMFDPSRTFVVRAFPIPPDRCGLIFEDVTARRFNERQLVRAQQLAQMGSWSWEVGTDRVVWSEELYRIYGRTPETFDGTLAAFLGCVHPDDRAMVQAAVREALSNGGAFKHRERIVRPSGEVRVLESQGECSVDGAGKPLQMVGLCRDITDDARAVRALAESEQRFRTIFEASPAAICVFDLPTGRLSDANPRFVELVGHGSTANLVGKRLDTLGMWVEPGEFDALAATLRRSRAVRETAVTYRTYGGQVRRALVALELIEIDGEERALGLFWRA
jgi:PAS domain S-box-containing protein